MDMLTDDDPAFSSTASTVAQLGISVEPINNVLAQQNMMNQSSGQVVLRNPVGPAQIATKLLQGFV